MYGEANLRVTSTSLLEMKLLKDNLGQGLFTFRPPDRRPKIKMTATSSKWRQTNQQDSKLYLSMRLQQMVSFVYYTAKQNDFLHREIVQLQRRILEEHYY